MKDKCTIKNFDCILWFIFDVSIIGIIIIYFHFFFTKLYPSCPGNCDELTEKDSESVHLWSSETSCPPW